MARKTKAEREAEYQTKIDEQNKWWADYHAEIRRKEAEERQAIIQSWANDLNLTDNLKLAEQIALMVGKINRLESKLRSLSVQPEFDEDDTI